MLKKWPVTAYGELYFKQILLNIAMFIPIGFLLALKKGWKSIPVALGISLIIELTQLMSRRGLFEFDDVIHNTLGALLGCGLLSFIKMIKKRDA